MADDCALEGKGIAGRRGIAGTVFVHKVAPSSDQLFHHHQKTSGKRKMWMTFEDLKILWTCRIAAEGLGLRCGAGRSELPTSSPHICPSHQPFPSKDCGEKMHTTCSVPVFGAQAQTMAQCSARTSTSHWPMDPVLHQMSYFTSPAIPCGAIFRWQAQRRRPACRSPRCGPRRRPQRPQ